MKNIESYNQYKQKLKEQYKNNPEFSCKIKVKYYMNLYKDDEEFMEGLEDYTSYERQLKYCKIFHYKKKIEDI